MGAGVSPWAGDVGGREVTVSEADIPPNPEDDPSSSPTSSSSRPQDSFSSTQHRIHAICKERVGIQIEKSRERGSGGRER